MLLHPQDEVLREAFDLGVGRLLAGSVAQGRGSVLGVALQLEEDLEGELPGLVAPSQRFGG